MQIAKKWTKHDQKWPRSKKRNQMGQNNVKWPKQFGTVKFILEIIGNANKPDRNYEKWPQLEYKMEHSETKQLTTVYNSIINNRDDWKCQKIDQK